MSEKKALKGLKYGVLHPIATNTAEAYSVGEKIALPTLQALSKEDNVEEYVIYADDAVYDQGADFKNTTLTVTVAELPVELEQKVRGAKELTDGVLQLATTDVVPEFAIGYAALRTGGGYRLFLHPVGKLTQIAVSHETKGDSNDIAPYELTFVCASRKIDDVYRLQKDIEAGDTFGWLDTVETLPAVETPEEGD